MAQLLAVLVGCNYTDGRRAELPLLHGAEQDASRMATLLATTPIAGGTLGSLTLLLGAAATTANIPAAVRAARTAQAEGDNLLFYFSGHGSRGADGLLLYTADSDYHGRALLADLDTASHRAAVILDCCYAGAITDAPAAAPDAGPASGPATRARSV
jgi:hypothetical protein